jgi:hypothetical protein
MPRAAWWVIAPASWIWQYLIYVPAYAVVNLAYAVLWVVLGPYPMRPFSERKKVEFATHPWFIEHLR